ncbi:MAG: zinc metallopeptidase [Bacteroidaceae bacterium]|nr:zinc metallopeptidase [Bacteroidaceae bacterium]
MFLSAINFAVHHFRTSTGYDYTYLLIFAGIAILSYIVQANLKRKFEKYAKIPVAMTGHDVAVKMLHDNGIYDVKVTSTSGYLTDHYNPATKTVNLSQGVYNSASVAAVAVAAHECGHAIQHAKAYAPLKLRSALVPAVSFSSSIMTWVLLIGILTIETLPGLLLAGIIMFAMTTLFSFVTLPVEVDASRRALAWLQTSGITNSSNHKFACGALRSAAYTYVVAALSSLATLLYYVTIFMNRRD